MRNYGQHNALLAGIRAARHDVVVTMDDDLQNPPEEIPKLLAKLDRGLRRRLRHAAGRAARVAPRPRLADHEAHAAERDGRRHGAEDQRVSRLPPRAARGVRDYRNPFVSIDVLLTWATTRFAALPVRHDPRRVGRSHYTVGRLVIHALNLMTGFTTWPAPGREPDRVRLHGVRSRAARVDPRPLRRRRRGACRASRSSPPRSPSSPARSSSRSASSASTVARIHFRTMDRPPYTIRRTPVVPSHDRRALPVPRVGLALLRPGDRAVSRAADSTRRPSPPRRSLVRGAADRLSLLPGRRAGRVDRVRPRTPGSVSSTCASSSSARSCRRPRRSIRASGRPNRADLPALRAIARTSHHDSRFYRDARFSRARCDALYETWIEKSCQGGGAAAVLVADLDRHGRGLRHVRAAGAGGGPHQALRGRGRRARAAASARPRRERASAWLAARGVETVAVATQGRNVARSSSTQAAGFRTAALRLWSSLAGGTGATDDGPPDPVQQAVARRPTSCATCRGHRAPGTSRATAPSRDAATRILEDGSARAALLTTSCTHALEMAALLLEHRAGRRGDRAVVHLRLDGERRSCCAARRRSSSTSGPTR